LRTHLVIDALSGDKVLDESDGTYQIVYAYDYDGTIIRFYYDANSGDSVSGADYFYLRNQQGDITTIIDNGGNTVVKYRYDAYGNILGLVDNSTGDIISKMNPYTYRGYRYDSEIGYYYLNSRYYNPEIGRFINADGMLGEMGDIPITNMYAYCANNPVMNVDRTGKFWETVIDIGFTIWGLVDLINNPTWENAGWLALDLVFLVIPFIPGIGKGAKAVSKVDDITDVATFMNRRKDVFVIGQNMAHRVIPYADEIGALYYKGFKYYDDVAKVSSKLANSAGYMHNMSFIASKSLMGARFIDIGMDASRAGMAIYNFSRFTVYSERFIAGTARIKNALRATRRIFYD